MTSSSEALVTVDGADEPLLINGSTGRPRPQNFTFSEFLAIPHGPTGLPLTTRTWAGMILVSLFLYVTSVLFFVGVNASLNLQVFDRGFLLFFVPFPFVGITLLLASWYYFHRYGPLTLLQGRLRISIILYGPNNRFVAMCLYRMGMYQESQNEPHLALACYRRITEFPICRKHPGAAPYYSKIGKLLYALGRYEEALEAFETCLTLRRNLEKGLFVLRLQEILHRIGQTHERLGNFEEALQIYEEAHLALSQRGYERSIDTAKSLAHVARVLSSLSRLEESMDKYQRALDIYLYNVGEQPTRRSIAELYRSIGDLKSQSGDGPAALQNYTSAVDVYRRGGKNDQDRDMQCILRKIGDLEDSIAKDNV